MFNRALIVSTFVASCSFTVTAGGVPYFRGVGDLPGGPRSSQVYGISPDGSTLVGDSVVSNGSLAFRWTEATGMTNLGDLPGGLVTSWAADVASDGSIAGTGNANFVSEAVRWPPGGSPTSLGDLPGGRFESVCTGVSNDGQWMIGAGFTDAGREAYRWSSATGMVSIGDLAGGGVDTGASAISTNGQVIVGTGTSAAARYEAYVWTEATGMTGLGFLPSQMLGSFAMDVSADGRVVTGFAYTDVSANTRSFLWTQESGMVELDPVHRSMAEAISADGSVVVGRSGPTNSANAFIWDAQRGIRDLNVVLAELGVDLTGWHLHDAVDISADGLTIAGTGVHNGFTEGWVARIPEPSTAVGLMLMSSVLRRRRDR